MDPADAQAWQHKLLLQAAHDNIAALVHLVNTLVRHLGRISSFDAAGHCGGGETAASTDSVACDPKPYDGDLSKCWGFIMQCCLIFVQRACFFPSDQAKINYVIGLVHRQALAWAQAISGTCLDSLNDFIARFEHIFHVTVARPKNLAEMV